MLALRSASARHSAILGKSHSIKNLPGSPSFSALSRFLSSFLLDGYGIDAYGLGLEALTGVIDGLEIREVTGLGWTSRGWTSSVFPLLVGFTVSFVASCLFSTTGGREEGGGGI
nr:hypothetical protein [Tanacetum cinerariifolium]